MHFHTFLTRRALSTARPIPPGTIMAPGSGLGFWHQFGELHALFNGGATAMTTGWRGLPVRSVGVSAGAVALALVLLGVDFESCFRSAQASSLRINGSDELSIIGSSRGRVLKVAEAWLEDCVPKGLDGHPRELARMLHGLNVIVMTPDLRHVSLTAPGTPSLDDSQPPALQSRQDLIDALIAAISIPYLLTKTPRALRNGYSGFDALRYDPGVAHLRVDAKPMRSACPHAAIQMYESGWARGMEKAEQGALCPTACRRDIAEPLPYGVSPVWRSVRTLLLNKVEPP